MQRQNNHWVLITLILILIGASVALFFSLSDKYNQFKNKPQPQPTQSEPEQPTAKPLPDLQPQSLQTETDKPRIAVPLIKTQTKSETTALPSTPLISKDKSIQQIAQIFASVFPEKEQNEYWAQRLLDFGPKEVREEIVRMIRRNHTFSEEQLDSVLDQALPYYRQYQQFLKSPERQACLKEYFLHKDVIKSFSADGKPAVSQRDIKCPEIIQGYLLPTLSCREVNFSDGKKSILYFSDSLLQARDDYDGTNIPSARYLFNLRGTPYYDENTKQCNSHRVPVITTAVAQLQKGNEKQLVLFYTPQENLQRVFQTDYTKPETISIDFDEKGIMKNYQHTDDIGHIVNFDKTQISIHLDAGRSYTKTVWHNVYGQQPQTTTGTWELLENNIVQLDNGQKFPPASKWGPAKHYCQLYPQECQLRQY